MRTFSSDYYENLKNDVLERLLGGFSHKIYLTPWKGVAATALLREVAEAVETLEKCEFDVVIKAMRPAPFRNPREIQRVVAKQLNLLSPSVTAAFDANEEDDDFWEMDVSAKPQLLQVKKEIYRAVGGRSVLLVLCNNIASKRMPIDPAIFEIQRMPIDPKDLGIPIMEGSRNAVVWTSVMNISREAMSGSWDLMMIIQPTDEDEALGLVYKEAVEIARYIDESSGGRLRTTPQVVLRCFWYCLLLLRRAAAFNRSALAADGGRPVEAAVKYFVCDEILQGDDAAGWEIGEALARLIGPMVNGQQLQYWQKKITSSTWTLTGEKKELLPPKTLLINSTTQGDWVKSSSGKLSSEEKPSLKEPSTAGESYRWISVCSSQTNNPEPWDFFFKVCPGSVTSDVSSVFWHFEKTLEALPDGFFVDHFSNVRVLDLLGCIVSPIAHSSFLRLRNLRMLRLERCKVITEQCSVDPSSLSLAQEEQREPIFFNNLWVLHLYNSDADTFLLAGKAFELMPNLLELDLKEEIFVLHLAALNGLQERMHKLQVLKLSGNIDTKFLQKSLSMAISLKELILTNCEGLEYLNFDVPATIETISRQRCSSLKKVELVDPAAALLPNLKTFRLSGSKLIAKLSLRGCRKLENVDLQELTGLEVLDLSCTAIKVLDIRKLPQLKQLFLLRCEQLYRVADLYKRPGVDVLYVDNYNSGRACDVDECLDSFRNQSLFSDANQRSFQAHVVVRDVRFFTSLGGAFKNLSIEKACFHIHIKGSSTIKRGINIVSTAKLNAIITSALYYADVLNTVTDCPRRHHPSPPTMPLNNHIEVDGGHDSRIVEAYQFSDIMKLANSLYIHDSPTYLSVTGEFEDLKCLRIERCPNMKFIFFLINECIYLELESIWLSQLRTLKALCEQGRITIGQLKHIYLEFCERLEYVLPSLSELHDLETINICYCSDLTAIFKYNDDNNEDEKGAAPKLLPKLRSIHLQELPKLQHIYKLNICAPSLEELKIMGCFNMKKLPLFGRSDARSMSDVKISCEKDWWDELQWDGLEYDHHSSLFNPKHCPCYKKPMKATYL